MMEQGKNEKEPAMKVAKDIAKILEISLEEAMTVLDRMAGNGLNFSECTQQQFKRAAFQAYQELHQS